MARFHAFAGLSVWMIGELGIDLPPPKERDDPNATVAVLVDAIKKLVSLHSVAGSVDVTLW